jgi:hypothetical protein
MIRAVKLVANKAATLVPVAAKTKATLTLEARSALISQVRWDNKPVVTNTVANTQLLLSAVKASGAPNKASGRHEEATHTTGNCVPSHSNVPSASPLTPAAMMQIRRGCGEAPKSRDASAPSDNIRTGIKSGSGIGVPGKARLGGSPLLVRPDQPMYFSTVSISRHAEKVWGCGHRILG